MLTVALCDDDAVIRETLAGYLTEFSAQTEIPVRWEEFSDGNALLAASPQRFDLMILDV